MGNYFNNLTIKCRPAPPAAILLKIHAHEFICFETDCTLPDLDVFDEGNPLHAPAEKLVRQPNCKNAPENVRENSYQVVTTRSEERRVGKDCRSRGLPHH